jgi:Domain of unknown function (DUF1707)
MRASDTDREAVSGRLREALAEGRLTMDEFNERLDRSLAAKTVGELAVVTRDLPGGAAVAVPEGPVAPPALRHVGKRHVRRLWASWATVAIITTGVWLASSLSNGKVDNFWPIWAIGPWGAVLLARTLFGAERERPGRQDGERDHR